MTSSLLSVPPARLEALLAGYRREVGRRRRQSLLVLAILAILAVIAVRALRLRSVSSGALAT